MYHVFMKRSGCEIRVVEEKEECGKRRRLKREKVVEREGG